jgi:hypothetical protein
MSISIYYSSCRSADIYDSLSGNAYTCGDFFWAASQINAQTQAINLNN